MSATSYNIFNPFFSSLLTYFLYVLKNIKRFQQFRTWQISQFNQINEHSLDSTSQGGGGAMVPLNGPLPPEALREGPGGGELFIYIIAKIAKKHVIEIHTNHLKSRFLQQRKNRPWPPAIFSEGGQGRGHSARIHQSTDFFIAGFEFWTPCKKPVSAPATNDVKFDIVDHILCSFHAKYA